MTLVPRPAVHRGAKNRHLNYRVVVNENYACSASKPTSKPCVKRPIELVAGSTPPPRPLHRATSGALNRLHISSPKFQHNVPNRVKEEKEHNTRGYQKEKNRKEKGPHEVQYQYHHESGSNLDMTLDTNDNETSTAFKNSLHSSPPLPRRRTFFSSSGGIDVRSDTPCLESMLIRWQNRRLDHTSQESI